MPLSQMASASTMRNEHPANKRLIQSLRCLLFTQRTLLGMTPNSNVPPQNMLAIMQNAKASQQ